MKRGLSLVLGDVGTGKTTLGRVLTQIFHQDETFEFHLLLNPLFQSEFQFLEHLCKLFGVSAPMRSTMDCMDALQAYLYQKGVVEKKGVVLLVDEGQNLSGNVIEMMRTLLNFETNDHKLLQIIILAQLEALPRFSRIRNFMDRVNLKYMINPLDLEETREMIQYRLRKAGGDKRSHLFTDEAIRLIYEETGGYPRKITMLCHNALEEMIMQGSKVVEEELIIKIVERSEKMLLGSRSRNG